MWMIWIQFEMDRGFETAIQSTELTIEMQRQKKNMMNDEW